jgi:hypothetical protein
MVQTRTGVTIWNRSVELKLYYILLQNNQKPALWFPKMVRTRTRVTIWDRSVESELPISYFKIIKPAHFVCIWQGPGGDGGL